MREPGEKEARRHDAEIGVGDLALRAIEDAKRWGRAEVAFYKGLASDRAVDAKGGVVLAIVAIVLGQAAIVVLLVGLVLTLATLVGPGWATLIVVAVTLGVAAIVASSAMARFRHIARPVPKDMS